MKVVLRRVRLGGVSARSLQARPELGEFARREMLPSALILDLPAGRTAGGELRRDPQQGSLQRLVGAISDEEDSRVSRPAHRQRRRSEEHTSELQSLMRISYY